MMKKNSNFYFGALAATALLAACATDDGLTDGNYDEQRGVVKTEFTISFPAKAVGDTRMTEATVQGQSTPVFRGISYIKLYPFANKVTDIQTGAASTSLPSPITLTGTGSGAATALGPSAVADNAIANTGALYAGNNSHLYQDIEIAIGTKAFMFYGVATPAASPATYFDNGELNDNLSTATKLSDIAFTHVAVYGGSLGDDATAIESYLNGIANATGWSTSSNVILQTLYNNFTAIKAGSWASVKGAVQQLYTTLSDRTFASTDDNTVKNAILTAIKTTQAADSNDDGVLEFQSLNDFPAVLGLPDGAIYINWQDKADPAEGKEFKMMTTPTNNNGLNITDLTKFVYPVPLYYRALSNIRTADESKFKYYNDALDNTDHKATWADIISEYGTLSEGTNDVVKYTTRSIALVDEVQYAVGRLDVTVAAPTASLTDIKGAALGFTHTPDGGSETDNFPLTGILIGGQKAVDYQFHQNSSAVAYTIYDKVIPAGISLKNTKSNAVSTLVFETKDAEEDDDVNAITKIAVEFRNDSGQAFYGEGGNIIYPGSKFYLVGTFDPYKNTTQTLTDNTTVIKKTFVQDYTTTANLVINSLSHAYNVMPDLTTPQLELGLSVNLSWNAGITQTVNIE